MKDLPVKPLRRRRARGLRRLARGLLVGLLLAGGLAATGRGVEREWGMQLVTVAPPTLTPELVMQANVWEAARNEGSECFFRNGLSFIDAPLFVMSRLANDEVVRGTRLGSRIHPDVVAIANGATASDWLAYHRRVMEIYRRLGWRQRRIFPLPGAGDQYLLNTKSLQEWDDEVIPWHWSAAQLLQQRFRSDGQIPSLVWPASCFQHYQFYSSFVVDAVVGLGSYALYGSVPRWFERYVRVVEGAVPEMARILRYSRALEYTRVRAHAWLGWVLKANAAKGRLQDGFGRRTARIENALVLDANMQPEPVGGVLDIHVEVDTLDALGAMQVREMFLLGVSPYLESQLWRLPLRGTMLALRVIVRKRGRREVSLMLARDEAGNVVAAVSPAARAALQGWRAVPSLTHAEWAVGLVAPHADPNTPIALPQPEAARPDWTIADLGVPPTLYKLAQRAAAELKRLDALEKEKERRFAAKVAAEKAAEREAEKAALAALGGGGGSDPTKLPAKAEPEPELPEERGIAARDASEIAIPLRALLQQTLDVATPYLQARYAYAQLNDPEPPRYSAPKLPTEIDLNLEIPPPYNLQSRMLRMDEDTLDNLLSEHRKAIVASPLHTFLPTLEDCGDPMVPRDGAMRLWQWLALPLQMRISKCAIRAR